MSGYSPDRRAPHAAKPTTCNARPALARRLHLPRQHGAGGIVAQWLGIHVPERIDRLVPSNTAAHLGPTQYFDSAIAGLRKAPDMQATAETFLRNWFPASMLELDNPAVEPFRRTLETTPREGIIGSWAAVRDADLRRTITVIAHPTLVIAGRHDTVTSARHGEAPAAAIPGAKLHILDTVHPANVEQPEAFVERVLDFLAVHVAA